MKVYLAAPFQWIDQMRVYAAELRAGGVTVTSRWLEETHKSTDDKLPNLTHEQHQFYALQDVEDVAAADVFVLFTDPSKTIVHAGRHVEFGIAVQRKIPIYVVGLERENIFHHLPQVTHFENWVPVRDYLVALTSYSDFVKTLGPR